MKMRRAIIVMKMERRTATPTWRAKALESVEEYSSVSRCGAELCRTTCWTNIEIG